VSAATPALILHHAALPHRGGAVRVARLLAEAQLAAGVDARLCFEVPENDPERHLGNQPDAQPDTAQPGSAESTPGNAIALCGPTPPGQLGRALAALPAHAVLHLHTSTDWPALLKGLGGLASAPARRTLLTLHDATPLTGGCAYPLNCPHFPACADPCPRGFPHASARQAEIAALLTRLGPALVSPSRWLGGLARQALPGLPVRVIPNGVPWPQPATLPSRAQARATLGIAPAARVALFAAHGGARAAYKSGPQWPQYWQGMRQGLPQALAFAAGGDEALNRDGLTVWPYVDRARLALLMRAADVLAYPTLADNHPLVLLEAAALELPVASFAVGGVPEIIVPGETGLLCPAGDETAFIAAARQLLADAGLCRRLGRAARDHGAKRFSTARMAADYAALLE
jgi:glycosyltransferase involved in cell wall biosynthesis